MLAPASDVVMIRLTERGPVLITALQSDDPLPCFPLSVTAKARAPPPPNGACHL